jgi:hypothetical protein
MMNYLINFPDSLCDFLKHSIWTFIKTMPNWPHEYIVRSKVDENLFVQLVSYNRANGYEGYFYKKKITYYDFKELVYWKMGEPIDETTIINRCKKEDTY